MSDQIEKFLLEEWRHESWEYLNDVPYCSCGQKLPGSGNPARELEKHRVSAALTAAGVAPQPEPEYEYQWGHYSNADEGFAGFDTYENYESALTDMRENGEPEHKVFRRPIVRWEPAPSQEGERP